MENISSRGERDGQAIVCQVEIERMCIGLDIYIVISFVYVISVFNVQPNIVPIIKTSLICVPQYIDLILLSTLDMKKLSLEFNF